MPKRKKRRNSSLRSTTKEEELPLMVLRRGGSRRRRLQAVVLRLQVHVSSLSPPISLFLQSPRSPSLPIFICSLFLSRSLSVLSLSRGREQREIGRKSRERDREGDRDIERRKSTESDRGGERKVGGKISERLKDTGV